MRRLRAAVHTSREGKNVMQLYRQYALELSRTLSRMPWDVIDGVVNVLHSARMNGNHIFVMGNGGSAATALHMACDLGKNTVVPGLPRLRVMSLTDNMALFSAHANDNAYENVFAEQLDNFARPGDVAIAISASGNSPNVLNGMARARHLGATTIGWCGNDGGKLAGICDLAVIVPNYCTEQIEDVHLIMEHIITVALRDAMPARMAKNGTNGTKAGAFALPTPTPVTLAMDAPNTMG